MTHRLPLPLCASALALLLGAAPAGAYMRERQVPNTAAGQGKFADADINVVENLGQNIPRGLTLQDGQGRPVAIDSQLGQGKPLLVTMGYFRCPMLCNLVHEGLAKGLRAAELVPGRDFLGLAVSIDPNENPKSAATNQNRLLRALGQPADLTPEGQAAAKTFPFLMPAPGKAGPEAQLAEAVGFKYKYDDKSKQFAHAAVAFVLTPEGKISRYLYGVEFKPRDLRLALVEASGGRVGTTLDRVLLTCFKYDPMAQTYTPFVAGFVRIGAGLSFVALATLLAVLWRREWVARRRRVA